MAEDETTTPEASAPAPAENGKGDKPNGNKRDNKKKVEVPIEELYDLSKPIPKVEKPNKVEHEKKLDELNAKFEALKEERQKLQKTIDETLKGGKGSPTAQAREAAQKLRSQKGKLIDEKKALRAQLDSIKAAGDKLAKDRKDTRSEIKFGSIEDISKEIAKLQRLQETTSMSLTEEKKLIKEMDALEASKSKIKNLKSAETGLEDVKKQRSGISDQIKAKDKEIDALSKQIDEAQAKIKDLDAKNTEKRGELDGLFKKREDIKKQIGAILKEKDSMRDEFRELHQKWWDCQRAVKAQKKIQWEEERKKREEENAAFEKMKEEEEAKKIPYEEEQALCDYLADYLERTYIKGDDSKKVAAKKEETIAVKEDPFKGFTPMKKADDEEFFSKGKGKKKRQRAPKKPEAGPFTLNVDSFEQFGLVQLNPPTSVAEVEKSIKELREKKEWFKQQPRGSVPTAKDIRKQNEKAAAKLRQTSAPSPAKPGNKFALSNDDFVPLGKGASNAVDASSWGQKPTSERAAPEGDAAPTTTEE